jgi:hypothetical protein
MTCLACKCSPQRSRLPVSKLGISAGIRNRMRIEVQSSAGKEKVEKELKEAEKVMAADYH